MNNQRRRGLDGEEAKKAARREQKNERSTKQRPRRPSEMMSRERSVAILCTNTKRHYLERDPKDDERTVEEDKTKEGKKAMK
ncbi:unnamed protein product [Heligmosomoides polygyrus]|uniref:IBB domain-containing protein n=1 Tax=Heligmosomoides polygyrus TaxID=6339 RepID=A0A183F6K4_HELPZ|nr:unnamed protein product [Heligmosomoides polygyrus]